MYNLEAEINVFKRRNRVMAYFYKEDYKTTRNLLRKLIDNLYYLIQIRFLKQSKHQSPKESKSWN